MDTKQYLIGFFKYQIHRLESNDCTTAEIDSAYEACLRDFTSYATIDDLSRHFGKSKDAVKSIISRKMIEKPKRNTALYKYNIFAKLVPDKWRINHSNIGD